METSFLNLSVNQHLGPHLFLPNHNNVPQRIIVANAVYIYLNICPFHTKTLSPLTAYNHMDAAVMRCDWDPDPPCSRGSDKVKFLTPNYIIT